jgi:hypothetical protein
MAQSYYLFFHIATYDTAIGIDGSTAFYNTITSNYDTLTQGLLGDGSTGQGIYLPPVSIPDLALVLTVSAYTDSDRTTPYDLSIGSTGIKLTNFYTDSGITFTPNGSTAAKDLSLWDTNNLNGLASNTPISDLYSGTSVANAFQIVLPYEATKRFSTAANLVLTDNSVLQSTTVSLIPSEFFVKYRLFTYPSTTTTDGTTGIYQNPGYDSGLSSVLDVASITGPPSDNTDTKLILNVSLYDFANEPYNLSGANTLVPSNLQLFLGDQGSTSTIFTITNTPLDDVSGPIKNTVQFLLKNAGDSTEASEFYGRNHPISIDNNCTFLIGL